MADKSIYAPDEESQRKYQEALDRVTASLDARKNRLFDPTLLAMAEGFLGPTRTGSFGEALGRAAGSVRTAEDAKFKEEQELAQAQLGVAQQGMQLQQQRARQQFLTGLAGPSGAPPQAGGMPTQGAPGMPSQGAAPSQGAVPPGAQAALAPQPPGTEGVTGERIMPPNPEVANRVSYVRAALQDPKKAIPDVVKELQELERKRYIEHPEGIVDLSTGMLFRTKRPDITPVAIQIRTLPGLQGQTLTVSTTQAREHDEALKEAMAGKPERLRMLERNLTSTFAEQGAAKPEAAAEKEDPRIEQAVAQAAGRDVRRGRISTAEESAASAAAQKELATLTAKDRATRTNVAMEDAKVAASTLPTVQQLRELVSGQNADRIFGPLTNPKALDQIVRLAETGVGMSGFNLGIPGIRDVVLNMRLTPEEQRDSQLVGQLLVKLQMGITAAERGPGAVTEFERLLFADSRITKDDTPATVRAKINAMARAYKYQMELADGLQDSGMQYDEFIRTKDGRQMYRQYLSDMTNMVGNLPSGKPATAPKSTYTPKYEIRPVGRP